MPVIDIEELRRALANAHARWQARQTVQSTLNDEQKRRLLGVVVNAAALAAAMARPAVPAVPAFAPAVDWRNHNGNHVSTVKDQGQCGSCVSFCICALVESMSSIENGQLLDLSEADLHFCSAHGANCDGWWPDNALESVRTRGVSDDACFPYASAGIPNPQCRPCANRDARAVKITSHGDLTNITDRKNYLSNVGPCSGVLHVFNDFYSYSSGVYHHVIGNEVGLHCVEVIGYSEAEQCWICKNSWGTAWGDAGFFKIAYGQCGIDSEFPFATARGVVLAAPFVYVANGLSNTVSVLGTATNTVVATVPVGDDPLEIALTPDGKRAYVANERSDTVSVIDTASNTVAATIPVGRPPLGNAPMGIAITPDGKHAYVTNNRSGLISVINTVSNTIAATIDMGPVGLDPIGIDITPDGKFAYMADSSVGTVSVLDTTTNTLAATVRGMPRCFNVAVTPDGKHAYVTHSAFNTVSVIDTVSNTLVATVTVGNGPFGIALTPDGKHAYVAVGDTNTVSVIDTSRNAVVATIPVGNRPMGLAIAPDGQRAYVSNNNSNTVSVIDTASNTVVTTVPVGTQPRGVGINPPPRILVSEIKNLRYV
jgi:YVTN family beta-propeller protein